LEEQKEHEAAFGSEDAKELGCESFGHESFSWESRRDAKRFRDKGTGIRGKTWLGPRAAGIIESGLS
jgi:hypothetical protein